MTKYLIRVDEQCYIVPSVEDGDIVVFESDDEQTLEVAKKIAEKTGVVKLVM